MKCLKSKVLFTCCLMLLVLSPAWCGWTAFKKPSLNSSTGSSTAVETTAPETEEQTESPKESSNAVAPETSVTEDVLENLGENSGNYDAKLEEAKEVLQAADKEVEEAVATEKPKKAEEKRAAIEEAKAIVDELIVSKAVLDEDHAMLSDIVLTQQKALARTERKLNKVNFGLGLSYGHDLNFNVGAVDWFGKFSPGMLFTVRYQNWMVLTDISVDMDYTNGFGEAFTSLGMEDVNVRFGVVYEF